MQGKVFKVSLTVFGAILLSTIGIFAADRLQGIDRGLSGLAGVGGSLCPSGMVPVDSSNGTICFDIFEVSPSDGCSFTEPANIIESEDNTKNKDCFAISIEDAHPWKFVSLTQAQRMCARSNKRLPTSDEWYKAALGTDPGSCNLSSRQVTLTGAFDCISSARVRDLIGNVWEWVDETVVNASLNDRPLPQEGYVASVDASGLAISTTKEPQDLYDKDYFWSKQEGVFGMLRGGYYGSETDGGLYTVNAAVETSFASQGIGFRCVMDI